MNNFDNLPHYTPEQLEKMFVISYCHTDYAWTNLRSWHICRYLCSYADALEIMRDDPDFSWVIDNIVHSLAPFLRYRPEYSAELAARVAEGRVDVCNGGYSLARPSQVGAETYIRNLIAGDREFRRLFGENTDIRCMFNADTAIGHSQLPQIFSLMGYEYYHLQRSEVGLDRRGVPRQFIWEGLDGSELVVSRYMYGGFLYADYLTGEFDDWDKIREDYLNEELRCHNACQNTPYFPQFHGCDDFLPMHNLFDTEIKLREFMSEWNSRESSQMRFSTLTGYFDELKKLSLPHYRGAADQFELSFNAPKRGNNSVWNLRFTGERLLCEAETLCAIVYANGGDYPQEQIDSLWMRLFEVTGHAIEFIIDSDNKRMTEAAKATLGEARVLIAEKTDELAELIGDGEGDIVAVNTLGSSAGSFTADLTSVFGARSCRLVNADGETLTRQTVEADGGDKQYRKFYNSSVTDAAEASLPPLCASVFTPVTDGEDEPHPPISKDELKLLRSAHGLERADASNAVITAGDLSLTFSKGKPVRFENKATGVSAEPGVPLFDLRFIRCPATDSWIFDFTEQDEEHFNVERCLLIHDGPLVSEVRSEGTLAGSPASVTYTLNRCENFVRIGIDILNSGCGEGYFTADCACAPDSTVTADIPFGYEDINFQADPINCPDSGFTGDVELALPGQFYAYSWASFNCGSRLALMSGDCSTYFRRDTARRLVSSILTLCVDIEKVPLDAGNVWVPQMDKAAFSTLGRQHFSLGLSCDAEPGSLSAQTRLLRRPVRVARKYNRNGRKPAESIFAADDGITVTACYREGGAYVVRLYENRGKTRTVSASVIGSARAVVKTDLRGRAMSELTVNNRKINFDIRGFEIVTLRISD